MPSKLFWPDTIFTNILPLEQIHAWLQFVNNCWLTIMGCMILGGQAWPRCLWPDTLFFLLVFNHRDLQVPKCYHLPVSWQDSNASLCWPGQKITEWGGGCELEVPVGEFNKFLMSSSHGWIKCWLTIVNYWVHHLRSRPGHPFIACDLFQT